MNADELEKHLTQKFGSEHVTRWSIRFGHDEDGDDAVFVAITLRRGLDPSDWGGRDALQQRVYEELWRAYPSRLARVSFGADRRALQPGRLR
ncbi:MAG TPA: hypothetical protein PKA64_18820 [Myxococcota bacterium]|nr:hypothetical protein [Myxococcota bacterium]